MGIALICYLVFWGAGFGTDLLVYRDGATQWLAGHDPYRTSYTPDHLKLHSATLRFALIVFSAVDVLDAVPRDRASGSSGDPTL